MIKVLLDACVPHLLRSKLPGFDVETAWFAGLDAIPDAELLKVADSRYDVLVTLDRSLSYQQNITARSIAIIVLCVSSQSPEAFLKTVPGLIKAIEHATMGSVQYVTDEDGT